MNSKNPNQSQDFCESQKKEQKLEFYGVRHTVAFMCFLGYLSTFAMRISLSVAIVAMTNSSILRQSNDSDFNEDSCPLPEGDRDDKNVTFTGGEFDWSENTIGVLLGSFYYGYILTNIVGGRAADYWGGRRVYGYSVIFASVAMILSPFCARISSALLVFMRVIQGVCAGFGFPATNTIMAQWHPKEERSMITAFIFAANQIGTVISMGLTGWISSSDLLGGWPTVFYLFGGFGFVWGIFWFLLVSEGPQQHPRISDVELKYIIKGCPPITERLPVPWKAILTCKYFWAIAIGHLGTAWSVLTLLAKLPTYLDKVLHIDILNNGLFSSLPFLGAWFFSIVFSLSLNNLFTKGVISLLSMRRISMMVCGYIPAIGMVIMCFTKCSITLALATFVVVGTSLAGQYTGVLSSQADIAPRFAGTILGLTNTLACIPGFVSPSLTSAITEHHTLSSWRIVFLLFAAVASVSSTIYIIFITTDVQPFNDSDFLHKDNKDKFSKQIQNSSDPQMVSYKSTAYINSL